MYLPFKHYFTFCSRPYLSGVNIVYLIDCWVLTADRLPPEAGGDDSGLGISEMDQAGRTSLSNGSTGTIHSIEKNVVE